ncbi:DUF6318 family protein [Serinicoccus kebangsaanensis]|uniref:DUF6318 family protein n=1 Tax=Serinicoccus kebangsaanensis TaxID=2602069 RepID=UPI00124EFA59|nr:DUF6318 family protein [Serinicoccus kebangsaanensis]
MSRTTIVAAVAGLVLLAGCDNSTEPSPPPTSEASLTTVTEEPAQTTTEAPEETSEEPTEEPTADGPPELPDEATEQTEAGAVAFAMHYLRLINYTGKSPETGLLEPLAAEGCESCVNHEESVAYGVENGDYLEQDTFQIGDPETIFTGDGARVAVPVEQVEQPYLRDGEPTDRTLPQASATLVVRAQWSDGWLVESITVDQ